MGTLLGKKEMGNLGCTCAWEYHLPLGEKGKTGDCPCLPGNKNETVNGPYLPVNKVGVETVCEAGSNAWSIVGLS